MTIKNLVDRRKYYKAYRLAHKPQSAESQRLRIIARRKETLSHYMVNGEIKCACCGENHIEFLVLDHINGGGNRERRRIGRRGYGFYQWLRKNGYPSGYQILCQNCNAAKAYGGCPHEKERERDVNHQNV